MYLVLCFVFTFILRCTILAQTPSPGIQIRLVDGDNAANGDYMSGRLEVTTNGTWGTVCDDFFDKKAARVVCRNFFYTDGESVAKSYFGELQTGPIILDNVECTGMELSLDACKKTVWESHDCDHSEDTGVYCFNDTSKVFKMNLTNGKLNRNILSGRVEVAMGNMTWGSVCDDLFTDNAAGVTCKYFNYKYGQRFQEATFGEGDRTYLDQTLCNGRESNLLECRHSSWREHDCGNEEDVGVVCFNSTARLRTRTKEIQYAGTVQMWKSPGGWVDICDENWDDKDASVACRELGFADGASLCCSALDKSPWGSFVYNGAYANVSCAGDEGSLAECNATRVGTNCPIGKAASAVCYNETKDNVNMTFDVRLVDGQDTWGRVEVRHVGIWFPICPLYWSDNEATVVCRMKGFSGGKSYGKTTTTNLPAWLTEVTCVGNETTLSQCQLGKWGDVNSRCRAAHVLCYKENVTVKFANPSMSFGRVLIDYDGVEGTICKTNLSNTEAQAICHDLGYKDGRLMEINDGSQFSGPTYISSLKCSSRHNSLFDCNNKGWTVTPHDCVSHDQDVAVHCYKDVRLNPGSHDAGAVELYDGGWKSVCGTEGFDDNDAEVICKELGFKKGKALPAKVYGRVRGPHVRPDLACIGNETSLLDCPYNNGKTYCLPTGVSYASVSCFQEPKLSDKKYRLEGSSIEESFGRIRVFGYNVWGYVCDEYWTDVEADVLCKQLKFKGGVAYRYDGHYDGPFFINQINCTGDESSVDDCTTGEEICGGKESGGVLCYKSSAPTLRIVSTENSNEGRLELLMDGVSGRICGEKWDNSDASVACVQLGYKAGVALSYPKSALSVFLSGLNCRGNEVSLFKCSNPGWKTYPDSACLSTEATDAGVFCFKNVRLLEGEITTSFARGKVNYYGDNKWRWVCDEDFDQIDALVICKEMGFTQSAILKGGDIIYQPDFITGLNCSGIESDASQCSFKLGTCPYYKGVARIMCFSSDNTGNKYHLENDFSGRVIVEIHGVNGTICEDGWDDKDADLLCKSKNFAGGVTYGTKNTDKYDLVWFSDVGCYGNESHFDQCNRNFTVSSKCRRSKTSAGVLCYKSTGVDIRLANGATNYGRVEVSYDGVWGTICDYAWSRYDARTLCRQLGYVEGTAYARSRYGRGSGPVYMDEMRCRVDDMSLLACPNRGFNNSARYCRDHENDASVYCFPRVRLQPESEFGYVDYWTGYSYNKVCAEGFTDLNAGVTCRELGFTTGKALCCSAFGSSSSRIRIANIQCTGDEARLEDCEKDETSPVCDSKEYASIVCSNTTDTVGYSVSLSDLDHGRVVLKHMMHDGYICSNDFTSKDADVVCKEAGYHSGLSYKYITNRTPSRITDIRWVGNISCTGEEAKLSQCSNFKFGQTKGCDIDDDAGAFCFKNSELSKVDFRLKGGTHTEGRIEILINGTWGSICGYRLADSSASVLCQHLGFKSGLVLGTGSRWSGSGPVHITKMICDENATSIYDCTLGGFGQPYSTCDTHNYDAALSCFTNARIVGGSSDRRQFGRVELSNETTTWMPVCDTTFNDVSAGVLCRQFGFADGSSQCCSALGKFKPRTDMYVTSVQCLGTETEIFDCTIEYGSCPSKQYITVFCRDTVEISTSLTIKLSQNTDYTGVVNVSRNGVWGGVCSEGFGDNEAATICKELKFLRGYAIHPQILDNGMPFVMGNVNCSSSTTTLGECDYDEFRGDHGCNVQRNAAKVLCTDSTEPIQYRIDGGDDKGRAEIYYSGKWGLISKVFFGKTDANVFCKQVGYVGGNVYFPRNRSYGGYSIQLSNLGCDGTEKSFLECEANWDTEHNRALPASYGVFVTCFKPLRIERGDQKSNGIIKVYNNNEWGAICGDEFDDNDATVACREMGFDYGKSLCCAPYGYSFDDTVMANVKCNGTEDKLHDCSFTSKGSSSLCLRQTYASIACFNGNKTNAYNVSVEGGSDYTGAVNLMYNGVSGRICSDEWGDTDATVVCKELGYTKGQAYQHYKSSFEFFGYAGPYWTSNVNCTGNEMTLGECNHIGFGNVKTCKSRHFAGVLCYDDSELFYRLAGGGDQYGRVEVSVNGVWGSICDRYWDQRDAAVFCKTLGYLDGDADFQTYNQSQNTVVWESNMRCNGEENNLNRCPHEGWQKAVSSTCSGHGRDAGAFCYTGVKLSTGVGKSVTHGPVLLNQRGTWFRVCDKGFTDKSAAAVCRELGFIDGRAICCSAYGTSLSGREILGNKTIRCNGNEKFVKDCLVMETCDSGFYASVACISDGDTVNETSYEIDIDSKKNSGRISVKHYGVDGRICSKNWTDIDASVLCKVKGYEKGIAYQHSSLGTFISQSDLGPFWLSNFSCTGREADIKGCPHSERLALGNCTDGHTASALCYNSTGIQYRVANGSHYHGRVEISVGGVWGTVCKNYWDNRDAAVFCRQQGFHDGVTLPNMKYGRGSGPIWLSHLQCTGNENSIHQCPHRGFNEDFSSSNLGWPFRIPCSTHADDAAVFCYKNVRFNQRYGTPMGAVEIFHNNTWMGVCDSGFDNLGALLACKSIRQNFTYGRMVKGSAFGNLTADGIGISSVTCSGMESDIAKCTITTGICPSKYYAGVVCSKTPFNETDFDIALAADGLSGKYHGIIEVNIDGVWGRICMQGWDDNDANVACKELGFKGGVSYLHIVKNTKAILIRNVSCTSEEESIKDCGYDTTTDLKACNFDANDGGVICYNNTGINYRLAGGADITTGRVEIQYDGEWGSVCSWAWNTNNAKVFCKSLGYKDGLPRYETITSLKDLDPMLNGVFCNGNESSLMTCLNSGFRSTLLSYLCNEDAYSSCYSTDVVFSKVRLTGGSNNTSGIVQVFVEGPNMWGSVCDDYWDELDAKVVCKQLGWDGGIVIKKTGRVTGPIWLDNVECSGNETNINQCANRGIGTHNCNHTEDAAVECFKISTSMPSTELPTTTPTVPETTPIVSETTPIVSKTTPKATTSTISPVYKTTQTTTPSPTTTSTTPKPTIAQTTTTTSGMISTSTEQTSSTTVSPEVVPPEPIVSSSTLAVSIVIPIIVLIIIVIIIIVFMVYRKRRFPKGSNISHERFHDDIIEQTHDGNISMRNQLFDMNMSGNEAVDPLGDSTRYMPSDSEITIGENGSAHFANTPIESNGETGFSNPLYNMTPAETIMSEPAKLTIDIHDLDNGHSNS